MENLTADGFHNENQNNGSSDDNSGFDPQFIEESSENHYDSHPEKKPHQSNQITNDEQDRNSYSNVDNENLEEDENFDDSDLDENQDDFDDINRNDVDENGFPNHKDSLPTSI